MSDMLANPASPDGRPRSPIVILILDNYTLEDDKRRAEVVLDLDHGTITKDRHDVFSEVLAQLGAGVPPVPHNAAAAALLDWLKETRISHEIHYRTLPRITKMHAGEMAELRAELDAARKVAARVHIEAQEGAQAYVETTLNSLMEWADDKASTNQLTAVTKEGGTAGYFHHVGSAFAFSALRREIRRRARNRVSAA